MCEVCAIFGAGEHWSDYGRSRDAKFPFADIRHYRAERERKIELLDHLFAGLGLGCEDYDGESLVVVDECGRTKLAPTLSDVWSAAESLSNRSIDLLDPLFLGVAGHA